jgi:hypothetical protein
VVTTRFPRLEDGSATDFDHVLDLFRASGFLPEAKERMLTPALPEVRRMVGALQAPLGLFKSLVVRNDDRVEGHLSSLRVYRRTWMPQHLASRAKAVHATSALNVGTLAYLAQQPDLEYLRVWFLRESTWPARVFGGFARKLHDPTRSDLRSYCHFHVATSHELPGVRGCVRVSAAGAPELALVERHFLERERGLIPDAEDLGRAHLELRDLDEAFARAGVQRRREILVAFERDRPLGFVLAELSSPGLNLYEALSSFRLYLLPAASRQRQEVRLALLDATLALYRRHGRAYARGLLPPDEARDYEALGLTLDPVTSMCWTAHRTLLQPFAEHIHRLLNRQGVAR